jgi:hypothetical protein
VIFPIYHKRRRPHGFEIPGRNRAVIPLADDSARLKREILTTCFGKSESGVKKNVDTGKK